MRVFTMSFICYVKQKRVNQSAGDGEEKNEKSLQTVW